MNKFLFVGSAAYSNRGCEAIVRGTVEILSDQFPNSRFIISSTPDEDPVDAAAEIDNRIKRMPPRNNVWEKSGTEKFKDSSWWTYRVALRPFPMYFNRYLHRVEVSAMEEADCALQVGGDNYTFDYGAPQWLIRLDRALLSTKKPLILWGASVGPFSKDQITETMMKRHLARFDLICARETETLSYLHSLGVRHNVKLVADPAFLMTPREPSLPDAVRECLKNKPIGLNLSGFSGKFTNSTTDQWRATCRGCIQALLSANAGPVLLVPHVFKETNDDHAFLLSIAQELTEWERRLFIVPRTLSAAELKWVIAHTRVFAGARTHSTIAGLSSCIPTVSIGYSMKARGINKDIFDGFKWMIPVDRLTPALLRETVLNAMHREDHIRMHLEGKIPVIKSRSRLAGTLVAELL